MKNCPVCGKKFRGQKTFCSYECGIKGRRRKRKNADHKCPVCNADVFNSYQVCCSHKCRGVLVRSKKVKISCKNCGELIHSGSAKRKFCSPLCSQVYRSKHSLVSLSCAYCGKKFKRRKAKIKGSKSFCCAKCCQNWNKENLSKKGVRKEISPKKRFNILERDNFSCVYCGKTGDKLEIDHIIPQSLGGTNSESNLVACCSACNLGKLDRLPINSYDGGKIFEIIGMV